MLPQDPVLPAPTRSVADEPSELQDNRRRILGSTLFLRDSPRQMRAADPPAQAAVAVTAPAAVAPVRRVRDGLAPPTFASTAPIPFPDLEADPPPAMRRFALAFKPRPILRNSQNHRLTVPPNHEMERLRENLKRETELSSTRLRRLGLAA
jgi:hypothetical protein